MVFIAQCPHPNCRKYMLLEDAARDASVVCLNPKCKKTFQVGSSGSGERTPPPPLSAPTARPPGKKTPVAARQKMVVCPQCNALLRLPPSAPNHAVKCPRCHKVFEGSSS
ncbi:MAG: hypothetical protein JXB10_04180 [Pirellulales bacterium]|nr:hypothetical protein [Pirellulales bacterium]